MPKRKTPNMETKAKRGRGKGNGKDYTPYLTVREVPSYGLSHRVKSWKIERVHHLLSNQERDYFFVLVWSPLVEDVREQYPLPLEETQRIAERLGIKHPADPKTQDPVVMTTDFLIDFRDDADIVLKARSVKLSSDLNDPRVIEKQEIERTYWHEKGIDWGIVTEKEMLVDLAKNVEWILSAYEHQDDSAVPTAFLSQVEDVLFDSITKAPSRSLAHLALDGDKWLGFRPGTCLWAVKHFIASRVWNVDMRERIHTDKPLMMARGEGYERMLEEVQ